MAGGPVGLRQPPPYARTGSLSDLLYGAGSELSDLGRGIYEGADAFGDMIGNAVYGSADDLRFIAQNYDQIPRAAYEMGNGAVDEAVGTVENVRAAAQGDPRFDPTSPHYDRDASVETAFNVAGAAGGGGLAFGKAPAGALRTFIGRNARTFDHDALQRAENMRAEGRDRNDIWRATGTYWDVEGNPLQEISDYNSGLTDSAWEKFEDTGQTGIAPLTENYNHPELLKAYPIMKQGVKSRFTRGETEGAMTELPDRAGLGVDIKAPDDMEARKVAIHELQHVVEEIERLPRGATPDDPEVRRIASQESKKTVELANKLEASKGEFIEKYLADRGIGRSNWRWSDARAEALREWEGLYSDAADALREAKRRALTDPSSVVDPQEIYERAAGEALARNAARRIDMLPSERRETPPWETQDIPDDQLIVLPRDDDGTGPIYDQSGAVAAGLNAAGGNIPPPPPGFELEGEESGVQDIPPPPPGFELEVEGPQPAEPQASWGETLSDVRETLSAASPGRAIGKTLGAGADAMRSLGLPLPPKDPRAAALDDSLDAEHPTATMVGDLGAMAAMGGRYRPSVATAAPGPMTAAQATQAHVGARAMQAPQVPAQAAAAARRVGVPVELLVDLAMGAIDIKTAGLTLPAWSVIAPHVRRMAAQFLRNRP
jgi:hypothetical protein